MTPRLLEKVDLTLYIRSAEKAKRLSDEFGVKTIVGTIAELGKLEKAAEGAHVVISIVSRLVVLGGQDTILMRASRPMRTTPT